MNTWLSWPFRALHFLFWYIREFILANLQVTLDILRARKRMKMSPAIIAVPAASRTNAEWTMISTLITLTPGTLTLTLSREHGILFVHGMFVDSHEQFVAEIQEMEDRLLRGMRRVPGDLSRPVHAPVIGSGSAQSAPTAELTGAGDFDAGAEAVDTEESGKSGGDR